MDELGPLEIEFIINNPEVIAQAKQTQATIDGVNNAVQASAEQAAKAITTIAQQQSNIIATEARTTVEALKLQLAEVQLMRDITPTGQVDKLIAYNKQIEQIKADIAQVSNIGRSGFDELGNAIEKTSKGPLDRAIGRVGSFEAIGARVFTGLTRQIIGMGVGFLSFAVGAKAIEYIGGLIVKLIENLDIFKQKETDAKVAAKDMNDALASTDYTKAVKNVAELTENIALAKAGVLDKTEVLKEYNDTIGKTTGHVSNLDEAEKALAKNADAYIRMTLLKAAAQLALNDAAKKAYEQAQLQQKEAIEFESAKTNFSVFGVGQSSAPGAVPGFDPRVGMEARLQAAQEEKDKQVKQVQDQKDRQLRIFKDFQSQAAQLAADNKFDFFGGKETDKKKDPQSALNALLQTEISLRQKIAEFTNKQNEKSLSPDQQALTQISDQFAAITFQIGQANRKYDDFVKTYGKGAIDAFNANPNNKIKLRKTDPASITAAENAAIDNQANLNENEYIQRDIEKKKKLYADYYDYRSKVGEDQANKDYADLLQSGKDFATYLANIQKAIPEGDASGAMQKRRDLVAKAQQQDTEERAKAFQQLLESVKTYESERATLTAQYQDKRQQLLAKGKNAEAAVLDEQYKEQIGKLDDANFEKLQSVKELNSGITQMSKDTAQKLINDVQAELNARIAAGQITEAEAKKVQDTIDRAQKSLNVRAPQALIEIGRYISQMGQALQGVNSTLAAFVTDGGRAIEQIGRLSDAFEKSQKTTMDYADLAIAGLTAVFNLIGGLTSAAQQRKQAEEEYYKSIIEFQNQYNIALDEEQRLKYQKDGNIFLTDYSKQIDDAVKSYKSASEQYQKSLQDLTQGQAKVGQKNAVDGGKVASSAENGAIAGAVAGTLIAGPIGTVVGGIGGAIVGALGGLFGGKKKVDVFAPLLQAYPQLIDANGKFNESLAKTLIATNQVSDKTKALLQNTISYYEEQQTSIDQINGALSNLANNLGSNLESALVQAFETGGDAAKAFGSTVSDVIGNIVQQFLFEDIFRSEFDKLNAKLKETVLAGGSSADITKDFVDFFKEAAPLATKFTDSLKAAKDAAASQGIDIFTNPNASSSTTPTTLSGAIKGITENQANVLEGAVRGMQLAVVQTNDILVGNHQTMEDQLSEMKQQTLLQMQIAANTKRTADNTDILPAMNDNLKSINKNTSDTAGNILRAAGLV